MEVNYKDTIHLPKTSFSMKANLSTAEPKQIETWDKNKSYEKMINKETELFVMPDGPPYANGSIHVGHALNKLLKDFIIKYKNLSGKKAAFIPGWDCHGLPIELNVTKKLGSKRKDMTDAQVRELCRKEAHKWVEHQKEQFVRLGILADWENPYLTLNPNYEADEVRVLAKILENGILQRGEKPVYWCPALQTALAAAEVEYKDITSPSIYTKFYIEESSDKLPKTDKPMAFVIWTTTPWTLPANYAISLNPRFEYDFCDTGSEVLIVAKGLKEAISSACKDINLDNVIKTVKGSELEKLNARHPFLDRNSLIILGDHVTLEAGTGCVHTAPGHGLDDYNVGRKYDLPVESPVDPAGRYTAEVAEFEGMKIWKANPLIVEKIKASNHLLGYSEISHSYAHNPRTGTPLIYRATAQWFIKLDNPDFNLRKMAIDCVDKEISFVPGWGKQRLESMMQNSPDWCVSRQRLWGVPIPVFYCTSCDEALLKPEILNSIADKMESTKEGIEYYFNNDASTHTAGHKCSSCGHTEFKKGQDILDVWFDSGVCHSAVQNKREGLDRLADIYLEGSDQHRGWFQTSLLSSLAADKKPPYKALITHGFVNDSKGHKMSKSKGNVVDPQKVIQKSGAEILRLWASYEDYGQDLSVGDEIFQRVTESYRRFRNTIRFMLGNLDDFDITKDTVAFKDMPALDQYALIRLNTLIDNVTQYYEGYHFYKVFHALNNYFTVELSSLYLDILKDRLYTGKKDGNQRRSSQTVIHHILSSLLPMMAPIVSFLAEEGYRHLNNTEDSIFESRFPKMNADWSNEELLNDFSRLIEIRSEATIIMEGLRKDKTIGSSLDAHLCLELKDKDYELALKYESLLREFFIVSQLEIKKSSENKYVATKAGGEKCPRCWHYSEELNTSSDFPGACPKCVTALS